MITEHSAGGVVFREDKGIVYYVLLHYKYAKSNYWDFARGNIETGETEEQTVKREVAEETNLNNFVFIPGFKTKVIWTYVRGGNFVQKEVIYYILKTEEKDVQPSHEHEDARWYTYEAAMKQLKFDKSKELLTQVHAFISDFSK